MKHRYSRRWTTLLAWTAYLAVAEGKILNEEIETVDHDYLIEYWNRDSSNSEWFTSDRQARKIANWFDPDAGDGLHDHYVDRGFRAPTFWGFGGNDVQLEKCRLTDGRANALFPNRIQLPPEELSRIGHDTIDVKGLCAHELHHMVQYEYVPWGTYFLSIYPFAIEGPACSMEDAVSDDLDHAEFENDLGYGGGHIVQILDYLSSLTGEYLWSGSGYHAALYWTYLMEQFGAVRSQPGVGVDFLERFYVLADADRLSVYSTIKNVVAEKDRQTTVAIDRGVDMDEIFQDFSIANWVRRYINCDSNAVGYSLDVADPGRFTYIDENESGATRSILPYRLTSDSLTRCVFPEDAQPDPKRTWIGGLRLTAGSNTGLKTNGVENAASVYLRAEFHTNGPGHALGFWAQAEEDAKVSFSVVGIRKSGSIDIVEKGTVHPEAAGSFSFSVMQSSSDPYTQLVAVANGLDTPYPSLIADFQYYFSYFSPTVQIVEPNASYKAYVGNGPTPDRFIAKVMVTSPDYLGSGSVTGLEPEDFAVYVGFPHVATNQAKVIAGAHVMGQYWLTCEPPTRNPAPVAAQNLTVKIGNASDTEQECILYANLEVDQVLVIDRSGSMSQIAGDVPRIDAARAAAQLFVDASGSDDQIGVVRFNGNNAEGTNLYEDAQVLYSLQTMNSQFERDIVNLILDASNPAGDQLTPSGYTSIGDGLYRAASELLTNGNTQAEKWIVLLSDGHENENARYADVKSALSLIGARVETIALGSATDKNLLQTIANDTSGRFYEVPEPVTGSPRPASSGGTGSTLLEITDRYLLASDRIHRRERLHEADGTLAGGASLSIPVTVQEGGFEQAVATLCGNGTGLVFSIRRPDGSTVPAPDAGYTATNPAPAGAGWDPALYRCYRLGSVTNGTWTFAVSNRASTSRSYRFALAGRNREGVQARLYFAQFHTNSSAYGNNGLFLVGLPQPLTLVLTDGQGPVRGADVLATVRPPGSLADFVLRLRDDGGAYDGTAGDGVYAAEFAATTQGANSGGTYPEGSPTTVTGSYAVAVSAVGTDNLGRAFTRVARGYFQLYRGEQASDADLDGMPDVYERLHPRLNPLVNDATGDLDQDDVTNLDEYMKGTSPEQPDTDGGGEDDRSELDHGSNPLDYRDDVFPKPYTARVVDSWQHLYPADDETNIVLRPGQNLISFGVEQGFEQVEIHRGMTSTGIFSLVTTVPVSTNGGLYADTGLTNLVTYYYRIRPRTTSGRRGVFSEVFSGTPREDRYPPDAVVLINNGEDWTTSTNVLLTINASTDTVSMKVSSNPIDFSAAPWIPFTNRINFGIKPIGPMKSVSVSCLFRDASGLEAAYSDSIRFVPALAAGRVAGQVRTLLDTNHANIELTLVESNQGYRVTEYTPPNGVFNVQLPTGVWSFAASQRAYAPTSIYPVVVQAGATGALGVITLTPLDEDADGVPDVAELRTYYTDRGMRDSDGDGIADYDEIFVVRTDPTNAASVLRVESGAAVSTASNQVTMIFQSIAGVTYAFSSSTNLLNWAAIQSGGSNLTHTATGTPSVVSLPVDTSVRTFIRVTVSP